MFLLSSLDWKIAGLCLCSRLYLPIFVFRGETVCSWLPSTKALHANSFLSLKSLEIHGFEKARSFFEFQTNISNHLEVILVTSLNLVGSPVEPGCWQFVVVCVTKLEFIFACVSWSNVSMLQRKNVWTIVFWISVSTLYSFGSFRKSRTQDLESRCPGPVLREI